MEQIIDNNENKKQSMTTTSSPRSGEPSTSPTESYQTRMMLIAHDSFTASAQTPTMAEKMERAETWARLLHGIIPENRLQECFDQAFRNHTSTFPISAYDLKQTWDEILAKTPVDFSWCELGCNQNGMIRVTVEGDEGWKKCEHQGQRLAA